MQYYYSNELGTARTSASNRCNSFSMLLVIIIFALITQRLLLVTEDADSQIYDSLRPPTGLQPPPKYVSNDQIIPREPSNGIVKQTISNPILQTQTNTNNNFSKITLPTTNTVLDENIIHGTIKETSIIKTIQPVQPVHTHSTIATESINRINATSSIVSNSNLSGNVISLLDLVPSTTPIFLTSKPTKKEEPIDPSSPHFNYQSRLTPEKEKHMKKDVHRLGSPIPHSYHSNISPRNGTDTSAIHQLSLLRCQNQTKCITPELQLMTKLRVYLCKKPVEKGVRFYYLVQEGLLNHPNVNLVSFEYINEADIVIYVPASAPWHETECTNSSLAPRLIVLEEFDGPTSFYPYKTEQEVKAVYGNSMHWYLMLFKRSFIKKEDGRVVKYSQLHLKDYYPLIYSLAEFYVGYSFNMLREIDVLCTLRGIDIKTGKAVTKMGTRLRAQKWVIEYANNHSEKHIIAGQLNTGTRSNLSPSYLTQMYNSKIIVTVNPADWEGDFRLWESLASGALIFVDPLFVPHQYPLKHGEHVIFFNNSDKADLWSKLDYYLAHPLEAKKIAINGYLHAMKYHRSVSMIDYVMRSAHLKLSTEYPEKYGHLGNHAYKYTAQYLRRELERQEKTIIATSTPGDFSIGY